MLNQIKLLCTAAALSIGVSAPSAVSAQEFYVGEIFMGGWTFCPRGSTEADGQLLPINNNQALFSLYGTIYGGDGRTNFALPDLRGRVAMHTGQGPGLSDRRLGQSGGSEANTLSVGQMPAHNHSLNGSTAGASSGNPTGRVLGDSGRDDIYATGTANETMGGSSIGNTGGGQSVNNMQPYQVIRYCVALVGIFPSRN